MTHLNCRLVCRALLALTLGLPAGVAAQSADLPLHEFQMTGTLAALSSQPAPQGNPPGGMTRGKWMALGAGIGAGVGVVLGEVYLGQRLDFPHGPDMLLGAGVGVGVGVLLGWALGGGDSAPQSRRSITAVPVVSPTQKAIVVSVRVKPRLGRVR
jgi:hypothetical protein